MRASVLVRSSTEPENTTGYKKPVPQKGAPLFRVVRWRANDPSPESVELLWEGKDPNEYTSTIGLPQWSPYTGYMIEFQERRDVWQPCCDPRLLYARPPVSGPHTKIIVVDADRSVWDRYWNFFESAGTTFIVAHNVGEAEGCFAIMPPLDPRDIVIFTAGDSSTKTMIRSLRANGCKCQIFVSEEKQRWRSRLIQAGCTAFFTKTDMWGLIQMVFRALKT